MIRGTAYLLLLIGLMMVLRTHPALGQTLDETFDTLGQRLQRMAEELHDHTKMGEAGKFYSGWNRPKGNFSGIGHRTQSCCNRTDCSPVLETEMRGGQMYARFELQPNVWYRVDQSIVESNQDDPRETPDGRAHGCIIGGQVACYVHGGGA
jgi:hypothetical protein